jgi:Trypsin-co-occurring domain 1
MTKLVEFEVGDGQTVFIEVEDVASTTIKPVSVLPGDVAAKAKKTLGEALDHIAPMVKTMRGRLNDVTEPGDEVEVKFGVKLNSEIGAVVGKLGGEMNYEVTLKWKNK